MDGFFSTVCLLAMIMGQIDTNVLNKNDILPNNNALPNNNNSSDEPDDKNGKATNAANAVDVIEDASVSLDDEIVSKNIAAVNMPELQKTSNISDVEIRHAHIIVERKENNIEVIEILTLGSKIGKFFSRKKGFLISLPQGAVAPRLSTNEDSNEYEGKITEKGFRIISPIYPGGNNITLIFEIPIKNEVAAFKQKMPVDILAGQVICTWTASGAQLIATEFGVGEKSSLANGLDALIAMNHNMNTKQISITVTSLIDLKGSTKRTITFILCVLFLLLGVVFYTVRKMKKTDLELSSKSSKTIS